MSIGARFPHFNGFIATDEVKLEVLGYQIFECIFRHLLAGGFDGM